jgi:hypothetical protein
MFDNVEITGVEIGNDRLIPWKKALPTYWMAGTINEAVVPLLL